MFGKMNGAHSQTLRIRSPLADAVIEQNKRIGSNPVLNRAGDDLEAADSSDFHEPLLPRIRRVTLRRYSIRILRSCG